MAVAPARRWRSGCVVLAVVTLAALGAGLPWLLDLIDTARIAPRQVSRALVNWSSGQRPAIVAIAGSLGETLMRLDRGGVLLPALPASLRFGVGAQPAAGTTAATASQSGEVASTLEASRAIVQVHSSEQAINAIGHANPGQVITFAPGVYRFAGGYIGVSRPGTPRQRIVVRAEQPSTVVLELATVEGFLIDAPYWSFENLTITGVCVAHATCEHAFHIVGNATGFIARNNTISDFNAHFKINADHDIAPNNGLIEGNTLTNRSMRRTSNPVTPIDLVVASGWTIRKNLITDFIKGEGNRISYGAFAKGGGKDNVFENNIVLCEHRLRAPGTQSVGLSFGGGGTGAQFCPDRRCLTEQQNGIIRGNLIASCSDDGIYLNRAAASTILHNTLIDTAGIDVRFPTSSATIEGNLIDGQIRSRAGARMHAADNLDTPTSLLFRGAHPVRRLFDAHITDSTRTTMPRRAADRIVDIPDLCGATTNGPRAYGAFADFNGCLR